VEDGEVRLRHADVKVPATIHDIIASRVDRLGEPVKLVLQGRPSSAGGLVSPCCHTCS